tara:strand:- start:1486 stop:2040 length:555 start_codon:yes stop_codon:yes gene_type:complete
MSYSDELTKAMTWLGEQPETVFLGQQTVFPGNGLYRTLEDVPLDKRIEMPVAEDMQMGIAIGMARAGKVPITIYPRMDFLLLAMNQLVNHLDKYPAGVIIRVCVGSKTPLDPGPQHSGDYSEGLESMLDEVRVIRLLHPLNIMPAYVGAYARARSIQALNGDSTNCAPPRSHLLIEFGDRYGMV